MKPLTYITLLLLLSLMAMDCIAQLSKTNPQYKTSINWGFGGGCGLSFLQYPPTIKNTITIGSIEGTSGISDTAGNLLYFTDGWQIKNKQREIIEKGLLGYGSSTQAVLMLSHPENDSLIHVFTTSAFGFLDVGLNYNILNKKLNGGKGEIVLKNRLLLSPSTEKLVAVNHQNGKDIWIVAHGFSTNSYFAFLLTKDGLQECPVESKVGNLLVGVNQTAREANSQGYMRFSNDGSLLATAIFAANKVEVFNFNNLTGEIELMTSIPLPRTRVYGLAFSPKNTNLFIQSRNINRDSTFIDKFNIPLKILNPFKSFKLESSLSLQNTLYDEIYVAFNDSFYLGIIKDSDGSPYFIQRGVYLGGYKSSQGLPNFNQSHVHKPAIEFAYTRDCHKNNIDFQGRDSFYATEHKWYFKNINTGILDSSSLQNLTYSFKDTGDYEVTYIANKTGRSDTIVKIITLYPKIPKDFLGQDTVYCKGVKGNILLQVPENLHCWHWGDSSETNTYFIDTAGTYFVTITNKAFCIIRDTILVREHEAVIPIIKHEWDSLFSEQVFDSYTWYRNGKVILGENEDRIEMIDTGSYELVGTDEYGCSARSSLALIQALSADEIKPSKINYFPNPLEDELHIQFNKKGEYSIKLLNAMGQVVAIQSTNKKSSTLNTEHLSKGVYVLIITKNENKVLTNKIIKN